MNRLFGCFLALITVVSTAQGVEREEKFIRVGGTYIVESIERTTDQSFVIIFNAEVQSGSFDKLRLESDHVHVSVKKGSKLRMSAEILSTKAAVAEVSQVVLFFTNAEGSVPVWMISNKFPARDLNASKYLDMHSPSNDFMIL